MSHFEAPICLIQEAETFPVSFGHTLPNSMNYLGRLGSLGFVMFGYLSLIFFTLRRNHFLHRHHTIPVP